MMAIHRDQLARVCGGLESEREMGERLKRQFPRESPQWKRMTACLDEVKWPGRDVDELKWKDVGPVFARCAAQALVAPK